jgi:hypothetical protein
MAEMALADISYNIVLFGNKRYCIRCERPPTATRLHRIAEIELPKEANDPNDSPKLALRCANVVDLFGPRNSTPRERPIRAPHANLSMWLKNCEISRISPKYLDFLRSEFSRFWPAARSNKARMDLKPGREVPGMKSRSQLQTAVLRRYQCDSILP